MNEAALVLDADAVLAYANGSINVGERISRAADAADFVIVPALCLAEAYRRVEGDAWQYLGVLSDLETTVVTPVRPDDALFLGGHARTLGSKHLAHAVLEAAAHAVTPIVTAQRERVTQVLAKEWPVIDL